MKKYKTIRRTVPVTKYEEVEENIPMWYYKFLLWLFGHEETRLDALLCGQRSHAWLDAFSKATKVAHSIKEDVMQKKLAELGFELQCNFPMATQLNPDSLPTQAIDPNKAWEVVPKKPN